MWKPCYFIVVSVFFVTTVPRGACADSDLYSKLNVPLAEQRKRFSQAETDTRRCMERQGFRYFEAAFTGASGFLPDYQSAIDNKRLHGYGVVPDDILASFKEPKTTVSLNDMYVSSLSEPNRVAYSKALQGESDEGCRPRAFKKAYADLPVSSPDFLRKIGELEAKVEASAKVMKGRRAWSQCMLRAGYKFSEQRDAFNSFVVQWEKAQGRNVVIDKNGSMKVTQEAPPNSLEDVVMAGERIRSAERVVASKDAECDKENLLSVRLATLKQLVAKLEFR
jgi:hypothetical protein